MTSYPTPRVLDDVEALEGMTLPAAGSPGSGVPLTPLREQRAFACIERSPGVEGVTARGSPGQPALNPPCQRRGESATGCPEAERVSVLGQPGVGRKAA